MRKDVPHVEGSSMTRLEFERKRAAIAVSSAHPRIKADAMNKLQAEFYDANSIDVARQQIEESKPDTSDIKGDD